MYIDIVPNRGSSPTILLRESFRENGKVRKRTIANLTNWPSERIEIARKLLKGELDDGMILKQRPVSGPIFAVLFVLKTLSDRLKITSSFGKSKLAKVALYLVFSRIFAQGSRLHALKSSEHHALFETLGIDSLMLDDLYYALDWLADNQERIEKRLFKSQYQNSSIPDLFLYDVTSSYFEGDQNELADWGYNRDKKSGKKQIVIGLLTDKKGEPIAVRVFNGNTSDTTTVPEQILSLSKKFNVERLTFVGDKGMIRGPQISQLTKANFNYITSVTKKEINKLLTQDRIQLGLFTETIAEVEDEIEVKLEELNSEGKKVERKIKQKIRYIIRRNPLRAEEIQLNRKKKIVQIEKFAIKKSNYLKEGDRRSTEVAQREVMSKIKKLKISKAVIAEIDKNDKKRIVIRIDKEELSEVEKLDGCYVIKTDLHKDIITAKDAHDRYKDLSKVERAFKRIKTDFLEIRPIFVRLEKRTRGHVFASMLSYKILREMRRNLSNIFLLDEDGRLEMTEKNVIEALNRITLLYYETKDGEIIADISKPDQKQKRILDALNITLPVLISKKNREKLLGGI